MPGRRIFNEGQSDEIVQAYGQGRSANHIATEKGVRVNVILDLLRRRHVVIRSRSVYAIKRETSIKQNMDIATRAYVAGLVDGEGSISMIDYKYGERHQTYLAISIANSDLRLLEFVRQSFGGKIVGMRPKPSGLAKLPMYQYKVQSFIDVLMFLQQVEPYLIRKRDKAVGAIAFAKLALGIQA